MFTFCIVISYGNHISVFSYDNHVCKVEYEVSSIVTITTVLPAKSDSDFMFCYKVIRDLEWIDHLCINPICSDLSIVECTSLCFTSQL